MATLLGPDGRPILRAALTREAVTPTVTGVRHIFDDIVASGLDPSRLARVLRAAGEGEMHDFLTLAEEMEEREPQYRSVLSTRKTAIKSIDPFVQAATGDAEDETIADAVTDELVRRPDFRFLVGDLLDGLGKGYSVVELIWEMTAARWDIARFEWRDPRLFQFDRETRRSLRVRAQAAPDGLEMAPFKYAVFMPQLKSGIPARNGLARIAVWSFMLKSFTLKDWASFMEVHGMPLRLGKYGKAATPEDRRVLLRAVRDLGSDAAAIIPADMEIELVETKAFSEKPFEAMASYLDRQVSKVVIGQTMTTDDGSSKAQAAVHDKVRIDIKEDDAVAIAVTINRDIIRPWVDLNFGPRPRNRYPVLVLPVMEREDLAAYARAIGELVDRGLAIEQAEVRDRIGHREPEEGAAVLTPRSTSARAVAAPDPVPDDPAPVPGERPEPAAALPVEVRQAVAARLEALFDAACPGCGTTERLAAVTDPNDEIDRLIEEELARFERVADPLRQAIEQAISAARDYADLDARLEALAATMPVDALAARLAISAMKGFGIGRSGIG